MAGAHTHEDLDRRQEIRAASDRVFGFVMAAAFGVIGLWPVVHGRPIRPLAVLAGALFALAALLWPPVLHPLNRLWTMLAAALNRITTPLVCGLLFYLVVTPLALVSRLRGKDPLRLRWDPSVGSYWIVRDHAATPARESMRLQF